MKLEEKLAMLEDSFDLDQGALSPETVLADLDSWDSLAKLTLVVLIDDEFGKNVTSDEIKALKTVGDILKFME